MQPMTLAEFYAARLDEIEQRAGYVHDDGRDKEPLGGTGRCVCGWPARVLREVEAKRKILETIDHAERESDAVDNIQIDGYLADDLRKLLALPFSDHPDYDQEWRP